MWLDGGWVIKTDRVELPAGHIAEIQTNYEYLGIPQLHGNYDEEARKTAISMYHQEILRRQLNGKKEMYANNMHALPVMRYPASILSWPKKAIEAADVKTQKLLTRYKSFHPKSKTQKLYTREKEGGQDLVSMKATVLDETQSIQEYINKMAAKDELLRECLRQQNTWSNTSSSTYTVGGRSSRGNAMAEQGGT